MPPLLTKDTQLHISATANGTYVPIDYADNATSTEEAGDAASLYVFGRLTPIVNANSLTDTLEVQALRDPVDPGQVILRSALTAGTSVFVRKLWGGPGVAGEQREYKITRTSNAADRNGTARGAYVGTTYTLTSQAPAVAVAAVP
jgi:hypothetical protein